MANDTARTETFTFTEEQFEEAVGFPITCYAADCHRAALALVKSGAVAPARVARGWCPGVGGQHSWVVLGMDCYDPWATVIDPTLWSYVKSVEGIWVGKAIEEPQHEPHGSGSIFEYGQPHSMGGELIFLDADWSADAAEFLDVLGPLDRQGWSQLAHAPVGGWPSAEIIGAMYDDDRLRALVPIDIVGMLTDRNPGGLYLREEET